MDERERAEAVYALQNIARDRERLEKAWDDVVIATMELEFICTEDLWEGNR